MNKEIHPLENKTIIIMLLNEIIKRIFRLIFSQVNWCRGMGSELREDSERARFISSSAHPHVLTELSTCMSGFYNGDRGLFIWIL